MEGEGKVEAERWGGGRGGRQKWNSKTGTVGR